MPSPILLATPINVLDQRITRSARRARSLAHHAVQRPSSALSATASKPSLDRDAPYHNHLTPHRSFPAQQPQRHVLVNTNLQPRKAKYAANELQETVQEALLIRKEKGVEEERAEDVRMDHIVVEGEKDATAAEVDSRDAPAAPLSLLEVAVTKPEKAKGSKHFDYEFVPSLRVIAMDDSDFLSDSGEWEKIDAGVPAVVETKELQCPVEGKSYAAAVVTA